MYEQNKTNVINIKMKTFFLLIIWLFGTLIINAQNKSSIPNFDNFPVLKGPYLGQPPPGSTPMIFAPGIISTDKNEHSYAAFSPDGKEFFWSIMTNNEFKGNVLLYTRLEKGQWSKPIVIEGSKKYNEGVPCFSIDGKKLYLSSDRPNPKWAKRDFNIWYMEKNGIVWGEPKLMGFSPNTTENREFFLCQTNDGSFYYTRNNIKTSSNSQFGLVKAPCIDGKYIEPSPLGKQFNNGNLNWTPYVDPEESYIIFSSNRDNPCADIAGCDLFISYHKPNGKWTKPVNMGPSINTVDRIERFPQVSPDGKYLFFIRGAGDFYWVDTKIIEDLKPTQL